MNEYEIHLMWDDEAQVWYCTSEDIAGLVLESGSFDALVERIRYAAPELLEIMGHDPVKASLSLKAERLSALRQFALRIAWLHTFNLIKTVRVVCG